MCSDIHRNNNDELMLFLPNSLHSEPRSQWLEDLFEPGNKERLMGNISMPERLRILEEISSHIKGIGKITIDATLAYFEGKIADMERNNRQNNQN